jgi:DNA-binding NarL/FixJ family response regulator
MVISRVLIADDYEPWRRYVDVALRRHRRWRTIGEATDGSEAIRQAQLLRPDLILMDIGLPKQNGIIAARQILAADSRVKILFLSEHQSSELVEAALATGASGYVVKSNAGTELLPAMSAIVAGKPFISASLAGHGFDTWKKELVERPPCRHAAGFYADEASMLDDFATFANRVLKDGTTLIVIGIGTRRNKLEQAVRARGVDVDRLTSEGRHRFLNVADAFSMYMVNGWPDEARFSKLVADVFEEAVACSTSRDRRVAAWGEGAPTLLRQGHAEAAIHVEEMWDRLASRYGIETLCGYFPDHVAYDEGDPSVQQISAIHSHVTFR